ncbi:MAG: glycosidase [Cyclobacteriaceae bacterium]|jgi:glycosidase
MRYLFLSLTLILGILFACNDDPQIIIEDAPIIDSTMIDPPQYSVPLSNIPDIDDMVMYEVNLRALSSGGDLAGVTARLDEIKSLGVNVVWLMPIYPIGKIKSVNSPYSVQNYREVNPEFGSLEDLRTLVAEAHSRDMAVILDWVANHTAWDNPWIENTEWYTQNSSGEIVIPAGTNWQDVADLNFNNQDMRLAMIRAMKYWILNSNIDGFRCDAADFVPKSFWSQAIDSLEMVPNRSIIMLAEGARNDHFDSGFQMNYSWDFYANLKSVYNGQTAIKLSNSNISEYASIPEGKQKLRFTTNHDESAWDATPINLFGGQSGALSAFVISTYMSGVPLIYGTQEVGVSSTVPFFSKTTINWSQNPSTYSAYQTLMSIYTESSALRSRALEIYSDSDILAFSKSDVDEQFLVFVNTRNSQQQMDVPANFQNSIWTNRFDDSSTNIDSILDLAPYAFLILSR